MTQPNSTYTREHARRNAPAMRAALALVPSGLDENARYRAARAIVRRDRIARAIGPLGLSVDGIGDEAIAIRLLERVRVNTVTGCWEWVGARNRTGYGASSWHGRITTAHRAVYSFLRGEVDPALELDHLCRVRHCVNPDHLEPVTPAENQRRSDAAWKRLRATGRCGRGHLMDEENCRITANGARHCRACERITQNARRNREREAIA